MAVCFVKMGVCVLKMGVCFLKMVFFSKMGVCFLKMAGVFPKWEFVFFLNGSFSRKWLFAFQKSEFVF